MPKVLLAGHEFSLLPDPNMQPGREGAVYPDPTDPSFVIKIPHAPDDAWREKTKVIVGDPLRVPDVAWPFELVYAPDGVKLVGIRMPFAANKYPLAILYSVDPTIRWIEATYAFRLQVAINLATAVGKVQNHGCVIGDLSPTNVLVGKDATVCLIDADSFQITRNARTHRCNVGATEYTPAELHGVNFSDIDRTVHHDAFVFGCLLFQLLVGPGIHPFTARCVCTGTPLSLVARIRSGIWPYASNPHPDYQPTTAAPFDLLHPVMQPLMVRCFEAGHADPTTRPRSDEWLTALHEVQRDADFVRIVAPQREAAAQMRQRQATLAATAKQPQHPTMPAQYAAALPKSRRRLSKNAVVAISAVILFSVTGGLGYFLGTHNSSATPFQKASRGRPTPSLYRALSVQDHTQSHAPAPPARSQSTPTVYANLSQKHR